MLHTCSQCCRNKKYLVCTCLDYHCNHLNQVASCCRLEVYQCRTQNSRCRFLRGFLGKFPRYLLCLVVLRNSRHYLPARNVVDWYYQLEQLFGPNGQEYDADWKHHSRTMGYCLDTRCRDPSFRLRGPFYRTCVLTSLAGLALFLSLDCLRRDNKS